MISSTASSSLCGLVGATQETQQLLLWCSQTGNKLQPERKRKKNNFPTTCKEKGIKKKHVRSVCTQRVKCEELQRSDRSWEVMLVLLVLLLFIISSLVQGVHRRLPAASRPFFSAPAPPHSPDTQECEGGVTLRNQESEIQSKINQ